MRVLGLDTAARIASAAVRDGDSTLAERACAVVGSHARSVLPLIEETLAVARLTMSGIDVVAVSIGPGSFTGLRIGLSTAKGLAMATGIGVIGVPTLDAYAHAAGPRRGTVWPVLDARKREVYAAGYRWDGPAPVCIEPVRVLAPEALTACLRGSCTVLGDGVDAYRSAWERLQGVELVELAAVPARAAIVARLGGERFARTGAPRLAEIEPAYCRRSEAEIRRTGTDPDGATRVEKLTGGQVVS